MYKKNIRQLSLVHCPPSEFNWRSYFSQIHLNDVIGNCRIVKSAQLFSSITQAKSIGISDLLNLYNQTQLATKQVLMMGFSILNVSNFSNRLQYSTKYTDQINQKLHHQQNKPNHLFFWPYHIVCGAASCRNADYFLCYYTLLFMEKWL